MEKIDFGPMVQNMECVIAWAECHDSRGRGGGALFLGGQKQRTEEHRKGQGDSVLASPVTYFLQLHLASLPPAPSDATTRGS